jgi:methylated-DNA-[protein]-cysteine S-methyltransferase
MTYFTYMDSPIGRLLLLSDGDVLTGLYMNEWETLLAEIPDAKENATLPVLAQAREQLTAYFAGEQQAFQLPLGMQGTDFQRLVWRELCNIPYGETISYGELARRIGNPKASRAVGLANGRNPVSIIVPCHRVIGADKTLTGYGGGLSRKQALLEHEARFACNRVP